MTIETKYNINDKVYLLYCDYIHHLTIKKQFIEVDEYSRISVQYGVSGKYSDRKFEEKVLFTTKQELLNSL